MNPDGFVQTLHAADEARRLVTQLVDNRVPELPPGLSAALLRFHAISQENHFFESAGAMASSLHSLLAHGADPLLDEETYRQVLSISQSLIEEIDARDTPHRNTGRPPLVTPIAPSAERVSKRVALYIDSAPLQTMLQETLTQAGFTPLAVESLAMLGAIAPDEAPAAIIADLSLFSLDAGGPDVISTIRQRFDPPPHLFCLGDAMDIPARLSAVRLGATRFMSKPPDISRLIAVIKGVTAETPIAPFKVLLIDDDPTLRTIYEMALNSAGIETLALGDPLQAPYLIPEFKPDVIVSDLYMPGCNGLELLAILRQDESLNDTGIILLSSENDTERRLEALSLGADDFLSKPVVNDVLLATVIARARRARALRRSRSEYRRMLERVRELESGLQSGPNQSGTGFHVEEIDADHIAPEIYRVEDGGLPGS